MVAPEGSCIVRFATAGAVHVRKREAMAVLMRVLAITAVAAVIVTVGIVPAGQAAPDERQPFMMDVPGASGDWVFVGNAWMLELTGGAMTSQGATIVVPLPMPSASGSVQAEVARSAQANAPIVDTGTVMVGTARVPWLMFGDEIRTMQFIVENESGAIVTIFCSAPVQAFEAYQATCMHAVASLRFHVHGETPVVMTDTEMARSADRESREALEANAASPRALNDRGVASRMNGHQRQAIEYFSQAIALDPSYVEAYRNRALSYGGSQIGQYALAVEDLNMAIALRPTDGALYFERGLTYYSDRRHAQASADIRRAKALGFVIPPSLRGELEHLMEVGE